MNIKEIFHHVALCALCWCRGSFGLKVVRRSTLHFKYGRCSEDQEEDPEDDVIDQDCCD